MAPTGGHPHWPSLIGGALARTLALSAGVNSGARDCLRVFAALQTIRELLRWRALIRRAIHRLCCSGDAMSTWVAVRTFGRFGISHDGWLTLDGRDRADLRWLDPCVWRSERDVARGLLAWVNVELDVEHHAERVLRNVRLSVQGVPHWCRSALRFCAGHDVESAVALVGVIRALFVRRWAGVAGPVSPVQVAYNPTRRRAVNLDMLDSSTYAGDSLHWDTPRVAAGVEARDEMQQLCAFRCADEGEEMTLCANELLQTAVCVPEIEKCLTRMLGVDSKFARGYDIDCGALTRVEVCDALHEEDRLEATGGLCPLKLRMWERDKEGEKRGLRGKGNCSFSSSLKVRMRRIGWRLDRIDDSDFPDGEDVEEEEEVEVGNDHALHRSHAMRPSRSARGERDDDEQTNNRQGGDADDDIMSWSSWSGVMSVSNRDTGNVERGADPLSIAERNPRPSLGLWPMLRRKEGRRIVMSVWTNNLDGEEWNIPEIVSQSYDFSVEGCRYRLSVQKGHVWCQRIGTNGWGWMRDKRRFMNKHIAALGGRGGLRGMDHHRETGWLVDEREAFGCDAIENALTRLYGDEGCLQMLGWLHRGLIRLSDTCTAACYVPTSSLGGALAINRRLPFEVAARMTFGRRNHELYWIPGRGLPCFQVNDCVNGTYQLTELRCVPVGVELCRAHITRDFG